MAQSYALFQFTPLREGRLEETNDKLNENQFQFTPLREGRQGRTQVRLIRQSISIHAPPRGATRTRGRKWISCSHFNSRPSARGDFKCACPKTSRHFYFNSRPSARGDKSSARKSSALKRFQFTPLREGRQRQRRRAQALDYFNSRPSARGDQSDTPRRGVRLKFQFTPLREGRQNGLPNTAES